LRGAQLRGAQLRGAVVLKSGAELKSGARRGCGEQALVISGIAISVDVDIHLFVIHGACVFDAATIVLMTFAFLLVFVFAVVVVLLWLPPRRRIRLLLSRRRACFLHEAQVPQRVRLPWRWQQGFELLCPQCTPPSGNPSGLHPRCWRRRTPGCPLCP
jgi:hypothetical protein